MTRSDRIALVSLSITVIGTIGTYLALANDRSSWPFGEPAWLWAALGGMFTVIGFVLVIIFRSRSSKLALPMVVSGLVLVTAGTLLATATIVGAESPRANVAVQGSITIDSIVEGQKIEGAVGLSGRIEKPLRGGGSIWFFVANLPNGGGDSTVYYLQQGPCRESIDGKSWSCGTFSPVRGESRQAKLCFIYARGGTPGDFVASLISGANRDRLRREEGSEPDGPDPRNFTKLPTGDEIDQLKSISVRILG